MTSATDNAVALDWESIARKSIHPVQVWILERLANGDPSCPRDLAIEFDEHLSTVSYHVNQLRSRGFLTLDRTEPVRGALAHYYKLTEARP